MSILGEITVSSKADYEKGFQYPLPGSLIPLLYTHSVTLSICVFFSCHLSVQLNSFLRDLFALC